MNNNTSPNGDELDSPDSDNIGGWNEISDGRRLASPYTEGRIGVPIQSFNRCQYLVDSDDDHHSSPDAEGTDAKIENDETENEIMFASDESRNSRNNSTVSFPINTDVHDRS